MWHSSPCAGINNRCSGGFHLPNICIFKGIVSCILQSDRAAAVVHTLCRSLKVSDSLSDTFKVTHRLYPTALILYSVSSCQRSARAPRLGWMHVCDKNERCAAVARALSRRRLSKYCSGSHRWSSDHVWVPQFAFWTFCYNTEAKITKRSSDATVLYLWSFIHALQTAVALSPVTFTGLLLTLIWTIPFYCTAIIEIPWELN